MIERVLDESQHPRPLLEHVKDLQVIVHVQLLILLNLFLVHVGRHPIELVGLDFGRVELAFVVCLREPQQVLEDGSACLVPLAVEERAEHLEVTLVPHLVVADVDANQSHLLVLMRDVLAQFSNILDDVPRLQLLQLLRVFQVV